MSARFISTKRKLNLTVFSHVLLFVLSWLAHKAPISTAFYVISYITITESCSKEHLGFIAMSDIYLLSINEYTYVRKKRRNKPIQDILTENIRAI